MEKTQVQEINVTWSGANDKTIASTGAYTSDLIDLRTVSYQNLALKAELTLATGTADVKVEYKITNRAKWNRLGYWEEDGATPLVTPDGAADVTSQITGTNPYSVSFAIEGPALYIALVVTGQGSNAAATSFRGSLICQ